MAKNKMMRKMGKVCASVFG